MTRPTGTNTASPDRGHLTDDLLLARSGPEEAIKSARTRRTWQKRLSANVADALERAGIEADSWLDFGRVFVRTPERERALGLLERVFGVASLSPVEAVAPADPDAIAAIAAAAFGARVRGRRFAVRARRKGRHGFGSPDVERRVGSALDGLGTVDLEQPDVTVRVEVLGRRAFLSTDRRNGAGGLPAGTQGKALALISGGFDSAVAAWTVLRRGVAPDFLLCNLGGAASERQVLQVAKLLAEAWAHGLRPRFHVVDFRPVVAELQERVPPRHWQVALKRQMLRAANGVARETRAAALVTGESLGQVSSQTLGNLHSIDAVAERPVLRPLIGLDKTEVIERAKRIGTAPLSERVRETCTLAGYKPATSSTPPKLDRLEAALDPDLVARLVARRRVLDLMALGPDDLRRPYILIDHLPDGARVIDCQPGHMYRKWHVPGAEHWPVDQLARRFRELPREATYVLYCSFGTQTPALAEAMQQAGYDAYAFAGGLSRVQQAVAERAGSAGRDAAE